MKRLLILFTALPATAMDLSQGLARCADALSQLKQVASLGQAPKAVSRDVATIEFPNGKRLTVMIGDITTQRVDAIVNAANEQLNYGGGVAGAIYSAAKPQSNLLQQTTHAINPVITGDIRCEVGSACANIAVGGLRDYGIKYVIEAVGPRCTIKNSPTKKEEKLIRSAYRSVVELVSDINKKRLPTVTAQIDYLVLNSLIQDTNDDTIRTIALPLISGAIFGCGEENVIAFAIQELAEVLEKLPGDAILEEVRLMIYVPNNDAETQRLFELAQQKVLTYGNKPSALGSLFSWF